MKLYEHSGWGGGEECGYNVQNNRAEEEGSGVSMFKEQSVITTR